jgi:hypothetical protein
VTLGGAQLTGAPRERSLRRSMAIGALVCVTYSALNLAINGVALDEIVMPAQIIAGAVPYPPGHPHEVYYPRAFSLPSYLTAALWPLTPQPVLFFSAVRNFLFLFLTTFVPFGLTVLLTRQATWGYVAAALTVTESIVRFSGTYPMWTFPNGYSQGHIGLYLMALTALLVLARSWIAAGALIGLLPSIHAPMAAMTWAWTGAYLLWSGQRPRGKDRRAFAAAVVAGLAVCAVLAVVIQARRTDRPPAAPYDVQGDGEHIYANFTKYSDYHRRAIPFHSFSYMVAPVAFLAIGTLLRRSANGASATPSGEQVWLLILGGMGYLYVFGVAVYQWLGGTLPKLVVMTMPLRFSNLPVVLLLPLSVAWFASSCAALSRPARVVANMLLALLVLAAAVRIFEGGSIAALYRGRVADVLIFMLWGLLFGIHLYARWDSPKERRVGFGMAAALAAALLLMWNQSGVVLFFVLTAALTPLVIKAGVAWLAVTPLRALPSESTALRRALLAACLVTSVAALPDRQMDPIGRVTKRWDRLTDFDRDMNRWLAANARPGELILGPLLPRAELQWKTGHPVLVEGETIYLFTYIPALAPTVNALTTDFFGLDFANDRLLESRLSGGRLRLDNPAWLDAWKHRKREEWQTLSRKYGFRLVLSPQAVRLDLPLALPGSDWNLYAIPDV